MRGGEVLTTCLTHEGGGQSTQEGWGHRCDEGSSLRPPLQTRAPDAGRASAALPAASGPVALVCVVNQTVKSLVCTEHVSEPNTALDRASGDLCKHNTVSSVAYCVTKKTDRQREPPSSHADGMVHRSASTADGPADYSSAPPQFQGAGATSLPLTDEEIKTERVSNMPKVTQP